MDLIESSLRRLRKRVSRFIAPSAAFAKCPVTQGSNRASGACLERHSNYSPHVAATHAMPEGASQAAGQPYGSVASRHRTSTAVRLNVYQSSKKSSARSKLSFELLATEPRVRCCRQCGDDQRHRLTPAHGVQPRSAFMEIAFISGAR